MPIESLHSHTTVSDGSQTYAEVAITAKENDIRVIAFTDHDSVMPKEVLSWLGNRFQEIDFVSGIEISARLPLELGGGHHSKFHIIGLFVDPTNKDLIDYCKNASNERSARAKRVVQKLTDIGFEINYDEMRLAFCDTNLGYPHIVKLLMSKASNFALIDKIRDQMRAESLVNRQIFLDYTRMMSLGPEQYPYSLLFSNTAYIHGIYEPTNFQLDMDESVSLIRCSGGVAILAHYYSVSNIISPEMLEQYVTTGRLDGIETVFGLASFVRNSPEQYIKELDLVSEIAKHNNCLIAGGADSHNQNHIIDYAKTHVLSGSSSGMTKKIVDYRGDSNWSTLNK